MRLCLNDKEFGYYSTGSPIGADGDFVTAPEISQMFGEMIGLWCAVTWEQLGKPEAINIVELGPGKGTLMQDLLRTIKSRPDFYEAVSIHLVEVGERLRMLQQEKLLEFEPVWHTHIDEMPSSSPMIIIANEFFDALPTIQYQMCDTGWHERYITYENGKFNYILSRQIKNLEIKGNIGDIYETSPARNTYMAAIESRLCRDGGAALIFDYGHDRSSIGDTIQAVRDHTVEPIFSHPGLADLTSHVDFEDLLSSVCSVSVFGPISQEKFLRGLGIEARAAILQRNASVAQARDIESSLIRLVSPHQMGNLFKVLALCQIGTASPAGFER